MTPDEMARMISARRARFSTLQTSVNAEQAANISALARENPSLSVGALYGLGRNGVRPDSPVMAQVVKADQRAKQEKGNIFQRGIGFAYKSVKVAGGAVAPDFVGDTAKSIAPAIKGFTRGAEMGLSAIGQSVQGGFRDAVDGGALDIASALNPATIAGSGFQQSDLAAGHREIQREGGYLGLLSGDVDPNQPGTQRKTDVDFGSGFFAGGEVASDAIQRRRAAAPLIDGKAVTIGRYIAKEVGLEPGNLAYNTVSGLADLTVMLGTDPTSYAGAPTKALQSRRLFSGQAGKDFDAEAVASQIDERLAATKAERFGNDPEVLKAEIGLLTGVRNTVDSDRVLEWLTTKRQGQQLVEYLSKETDFGKLYDATKGKVDPQTLLALSSREMTGDEVIEILGPKLGRTARTDQKFAIDAVAKAEQGISSNLGTLATAKFKQKARDVRLFGTVPERVLPKNDLDETLKNASAFMRNAFVSGPERSAILRKFAEVDGGEGMLDVTQEMMKAGAKKAVEEFGIPQARADDLFRIFKDSSSDRRLYYNEQVVVNGERMWANKAFNLTDEFFDDGRAKEVRAVPHLAAQFLNNNIPLPDPRAIRAEMSRYRRILANPAIKIPTTVLQSISDNIFKPMVLLRPAYITRNQIDEQFRPAAAGLNSMFSHPVQYLQWLMTDQASMGRALARATSPLPERAQFKSRGATFGPDGQAFDENADAIRKAREEYKDAQRAGDKAQIAEKKAAYEAAKKAIQSITPFTDEVSAFARAQTGGLGNWRNRSYAQMNGDERYQISDSNYARAMGERLHLIHHDPLAKRIARGDDLEQIKADFWRGPLQRFRLDLAKQNKRMSLLEDELGAAQYVDETVKFIKSATGESPELYRAAATGRIGDVPLTAGDALEITPDALAKLDELKQMEGFQGPPAVIGSTLLRGGGEQASKYNQVVDWAFYQLNDRPVRYLSKSPAFRQRYYQRMENLLSFVDAKAADDIIESARVANLRPKDIKRLQSKRGAGGQMTYEEADLVAKADALEFTRDLFYDLHHRGQFFDVTRLLFPFGEVFLDSAKKYAELTTQNPVLPYRLMQVIEGARNADLNGDGQGFFYTDEQTNEEMFSFPFSDKFLGLVGQEGAGQFRSPVKNLNILGTTVIPGFGPGVQIAAASILPDEPEFNAVRQLISPYGDRTLDGGALESFLPAWFSKFRTAELVPFMDANPKQAKAFVQTTKDWMGYLASTGEYNLQDPADSQRLTEDAKKKATATFFIRGMAQSIAPSPPSPEFVAYDKDGTLQTQFKLAEEYRRIQKEQDELGTPESTNRVFIETFGEQAVLAVIPNTKSAEDRSPIPPNRKALEFYQANKKAAERFPTVFGLFAPDEEAAEFDFVAYNRQIEEGERVVVSPEEAVRRANQNVARMIYTQAKEVAGPKPSKEQRAALSDLKALLSEDYPGYSASFTNDTPALLEDLKRAAKDPSLSSTSAGEGLNIWLQAREAAEEGAQRRFGVSWKTAEASRPIRDMMRALADELSTDFPGFSNIYERALEREMVADR